MEKDRNIKNLLVKSLFIIGIFVIVLILAFSVVRIIPRLFYSFANIGESVRSPFSRNSLQIEAEKDKFNSGELILLSWKYEPAEGGVYEIDYSCVNHLDLELGTSEGNKAIRCDTIYNISPETKTISLLPTLTRENILADFVFNVRFVNTSGSILASDKINLTVVRRSSTDLISSGSIIDAETIERADYQTNIVSQPQTTEPVTTTHQAQTTSVLSLPDLRIYDYFASNDTTVVFSVSNIGSVPTSPWYFNYAMPNGDVTSSPIQNSLRPGEAIRYTLKLDNVPQGDVAIVLDPRNNIRELSLLNNFAVIGIRGDRFRNDYRDEFIDADLKIYDLETGRITDSRFITDSLIYEKDTAAIRFMVSNIGGKNTGTWRFEVRGLPYSNQNNFESARQTSLNPGETREVIVEFERPENGTYDIRVELDSQNDVREESTRNNTASTTLRIR